MPAAPPERETWTIAHLAADLEQPMCWHAAVLAADPGVACHERIQAFALSVREGGRSDRKRKNSIAAALLSFLAFDFFLVPPTLTPRFASGEYLVTAVVLLIVGLVTSALAARVRREAHSAARAEMAENDERIRSSLLAVFASLDAGADDHATKPFRRASCGHDCAWDCGPGRHAFGAAEGRRGSRQARSAALRSHLRDRASPKA
jgi:hypothetical protein